MAFAYFFWFYLAPFYFVWFPIHVLYWFHDSVYLDSEMVILADDDTTIYNRGGTACSVVCVSHGCHQNMRDIHTEATPVHARLMARVGCLSCFHGCCDLGFILFHRAVVGVY